MQAVPVMQLPYVIPNIFFDAYIAIELNFFLHSIVLDIYNVTCSAELYIMYIYIW